MKIARNISLSNGKKETENNSLSPIAPAKKAIAILPNKTPRNKLNG